MGFLSGLFGGNKQDKALQEAFEHIKRVLEDEEFQLDLINPEMKEIIKNCPAYDKDPNGTGPFGLSEKESDTCQWSHPRLLAYLSRLETNKGERLFFIGSVP
ncbi:MAG: hypothetical protein IPF39_05770 [Comamonadaceae bacterium]|uniref:hypothetical protein n=1 Tax=Candidatus Skiveiella danica TaxID=3386177 RepID=UPI00390B7A08|nr:hypothetical protein [Comamonadaceae bacterium]